MFRYYRIHRIIIEKKDFWRYSPLVFVVFLAPAFIAVLVMSCLPGTVYFDTTPTLMSCMVDHNSVNYPLAAIFVLYLIACLVFVFFHFFFFFFSLIL